MPRAPATAVSISRTAARTRRGATFELVGGTEDGGFDGWGIDGWGWGERRWDAGGFRQVHGGCPRPTPLDYCASTPASWLHVGRPVTPASAAQAVGMQ